MIHCLKTLLTRSLKKFTSEKWARKNLHLKFEFPAKTNRYSRYWPRKRCWKSLDVYFKDYYPHIYCSISTKWSREILCGFLSPFFWITTRKFNCRHCSLFRLGGGSCYYGTGRTRGRNFLGKLWREMTKIGRSFSCVRWSQKLVFGH